MKTKITRIIKGRPAHVFPKELIIEIVSEIDSGKISIEEVMSKYEISQRNTVRNWLKIYSKNEILNLKTIPDDKKRQIIIQIESGALTFQEACRINKVTQRTLQIWYEKFSCINFDKKIQEKMKTSELKPENNLEKKLLEEMKLKIASLETMIDIAEKEFKIEIRKKFGSKQLQC